MRMSKLFLATVLCFCGCIGIKKPLPTTAELVSSYDVNALKSTDNTYRIQTGQPVKVYSDGKESELKFDTDWFIVHKDWLKQFNENQDYIIKALQTREKTPDYNVPLILALFVFCLLMYVLILRISKNGRHNR